MVDIRNMKNCEIKVQLTKATSGKGTDLLTPQECMNLVILGEESDLFIVSIEVYELRDGFEVPRVDLSLYNICNEEGICDLPILEKKHACRLAFDDMTKLIKNERSNFALRLWLEAQEY